MRVLVACHGHPALRPGGSEVAAYRLFAGLSGVAGVEAFFLGASRGAGPVSSGAPGGVAIGQRFASGREYVYAVGAFDWFRMANHDPAFPGAFAALLRALRPDILHLHHFLAFGIEAVAIARRVLPDLRIVLTLHEYLLICHHYGQMVTRPGRVLCERADPVACQACFPHLLPSDFTLRKMYLLRFLAEVDLFVAPSRFLAQRFLDWGIAEDRLIVMGNLVADGVRAPPRGEDGFLVVGYFGQVTALKGVGVLLDAAALLFEAGRRDIRFEIHGGLLGDAALVDDLPQRLAGKLPNVVYYGAYLPGAVDGLMAGVDVVCVPSLWWENQPTVMAEARRVGRPVLCSDIGGMREMAGEGDCLFRVGSAADLARAIEGLFAVES